ncbi:MAG: LysR family transcriptional regulator [Mesorhizobium sp.]|uniref:LysR substrate-binding domain-containing protein n=1 Tax=Mesorhizobium sp. TaxID=1871066 RepID=UPI001AD3E9EE|nr:LysR substrate-binding domain-containing protein [Mesorhizobium sp.]MBN9221184.1 LysR family transcriptional regulator [Mesorhizobium sp.]
MTLPSLNAARVFEAAARLGSLKDAAIEMKLTRSAVSHHIRSLEDALGAKLFNRGFRQVTLTTRGAYYARRLTEAFRMIEDATEEASVHSLARPRKSRHITLSCEPTFMNLWLADRLPKFRKLNADFEFEVSIHSANEDPKADLCIVFAFEDATDPLTKPLLSLSITPVCSPSLHRGEIPLRVPADLARHRLLHENTTIWWEQWLAQEGICDLDLKGGTLFHDPTLVIREAVNGGGVALADTIMSEDLLNQGLLVAPFPIRHGMAAGYYLRQRQGSANKPGVRQLREWLFAEIERHKQHMQLP